MKKRLLQLSIFLFLSTTTQAYYQAEQGRWLNRDPIGENGGVNLFGLLANDAFNKIDKLGQSYGNPVSGPEGPVGPSDPYAPNPYDPPPPPPPKGGGIFTVNCGGLVTPCCSKLECLLEVHARGTACRKDGSKLCSFGCGVACIGASGGYFACVAVCWTYCELAVMSGCSAGELVCHVACATCPKD